MLLAFVAIGASLLPFEGQDRIKEDLGQKKVDPRVMSPFDVVKVFVSRARRGAFAYAANVCQAVYARFGFVAFVVPLVLAAAVFFACFRSKVKQQ